MMIAVSSAVPVLIQKNEDAILTEWIKHQLAAATRRKDLLSEADLRRQSKGFLTVFQQAIQEGDLDEISRPPWRPVCAYLEELSMTRLSQGFSPSETATFVFSLKQPLFSLLSKEAGQDRNALGEEVWLLTTLLDKLGLFTVECFVKGREEVIKRQQAELLELSTPVVKLWDGVLAVPLIGTLDSARTQTVMENLLQAIVDNSAAIAIVDITGVPTVDTLVAQHLIKTVSAARLMGAECIISGIRPPIAQAMVHLGVGFTEIITKSTLAAAVQTAFAKLGLSVVGSPKKA